MTIIIQEYNPLWADYFTLEKVALGRILGNIDYRIEHIGSTAVIGLGGKPVIDIMLGIFDFSIADSLFPKIETLEYTYKKKYEKQYPFIRLFIKEKFAVRSHQIYLVEYGSQYWLKHLKFRDYLRQNKKERDRYFQFKKALSKLHWKDIDEYNDAKSNFINEIEANIS